MDDNTQHSPSFTPDALANGRKWVEALRSNTYKQGTGRLRTKADTFCCLGVACELYRLEHPEVVWEMGLSGPLFLGESSYLPKAVRGWLGIDSYDPEVGATGSLTKVNDGGENFAAIATLIEDHLYGGRLYAKG